MEGFRLSKSLIGFGFGRQMPSAPRGRSGCPGAWRAADGCAYDRLVQPALEGVRADWRAFAEHTEAACKAGSAVATFSNLGGDALLVAPCGPSPPAEERRDGGSLQTYAHAQAFFRGAPLEERRALLREVACQALREVEGGRKEPLWVSTSGAGVSWLHVRLDSAPKYYTFSPYRVMA